METHRTPDMTGHGRTDRAHGTDTNKDQRDRAPRENRTHNTTRGTKQAGARPGPKKIIMNNTSPTKQTKQGTGPRTTGLGLEGNNTRH